MQEMYHYYLITGEITYLVKDEKGQDYVNRVNANTLAPLDQVEINLNTIGVIQQQLQKQLFTRTGEPEKVLDVVITNISYLGHMTKEAFGTPPMAESANDE